MERWLEPIVGYVQWHLLRGKPLDAIKSELDNHRSYPAVNTTEWAAVVARATANVRATIEARCVDRINTPICELYDRRKHARE